MLNVKTGKKHCNNIKAKKQKKKKKKKTKNAHTNK